VQLVTNPVLGATVLLHVQRVLVHLLADVAQLLGRQNATRTLVSRVRSDERHRLSDFHLSRSRDLRHGPTFSNQQLRFVTAHVDDIPDTMMRQVHTIEHVR